MADLMALLTTLSSSSPGFVGHTLSPLQGCLVQTATLALFILAVWAFWATGLAAAIAEALGRFVA